MDLFNYGIVSHIGDVFENASDIILINAMKTVRNLLDVDVNERIRINM